MPDIYEENFKVRFSDCNRLCCVKTEALFDYFQEVAGNHATRLGCGFDTLGARHQAWILTRIHLQLSRIPHKCPQITVRTWPSGIYRMYASREAVFSDPDGEFGTISSYWIVLDTEKMRPLRLPDALPVPLPDNEQLPRFYDLSPHFSLNEVEAPWRLTVPEEFIDFNGHVNNCRYHGLVSDWLALHLGQPAAVTELTAHYQKALLAGKAAVVTGHTTEAGQFAVQISMENEAGAPQSCYIATGKFSVQA